MSALMHSTTRTHTLRTELLNMSDTELKEFRKGKRKEAARGDVEKALKAYYGIPSAGNSWGKRLG